MWDGIRCRELVQGGGTPLGALEAHTPSFGVAGVWFGAVWRDVGCDPPPPYSASAGGGIGWDGICCRELVQGCGTPLGAPEAGAPRLVRRRRVLSAADGRNLYGYHHSQHDTTRRWPTTHL